MPITSLIHTLITLPIPYLTNYMLLVDSSFPYLKFWAAVLLLYVHASGAWYYVRVGRIISYRSLPPAHLTRLFMPTPMRPSPVCPSLLLSSHHPPCCHVYIVTLLIEIRLYPLPSAPNQMLHSFALTVQTRRLFKIDDLLSCSLKRQLLSILPSTPCKIHPQFFSVAFSSFLPIQQ